MSSDRAILEGRYTQGRPFVRARVVIVNPETGRQTAIEKDFKIDTGFDGGLHIAQLHRWDVRQIGVNLVVGPIGVAGGQVNSAYHCFAYLQKIGDYEFPAPGIEAELVLHGSSRHGLLGMELLKNWITKFDGPNQFLTIASTQHTQNREI